MRRLVLWLLALLTRVFFRRVEVVGEAQLPSSGGLVYAPNHPNGLIDPLFLLVLPASPAAFLAKEPLFRMPVVGSFVRALECLPVYRSKDGHDTSANQRTMAAARARLEGGGAIGIFPEGASHSGPALLPLKTGAARIALGAAAGSDTPVHVVPCGLFYSDKVTFRSEAVLVYGAPIEVPRVSVDASAEPPREAARALTERIKVGLDEVVLQAQSSDVLALAGLATRLFAGVRRARGERESLPVLEGSGVAGRGERIYRLQRRMLERYAAWQRADAGRIEDLAQRLTALDCALQLHDARLDDPAPDNPGPGPRVRLVLSAPLALPAVALHYPLYRAIGWLALRTAGSESDVVATAKLLLGMLGFPLQWIVLAGVAGLYAGPVAGLAALLMQPALAALALRWSEWLEPVATGLRLGLETSNQPLRTLLDERERLYDDLIALDEAPPA